MKYSSIFTSIVFSFALYSIPASAVFINEIHYDNSGSDISEGIELAGAAGTDLIGWQLLLYNGGDGQVYRTIALSGIISDMQNGFGVLNFASSGIQNGVSDGIALVDAGNSVLQFLSYEGIFTATNGAANGMTSVDIGVAETGSTPVGYSLQLSGVGNVYSDFVWSSPAAQTAGAINSGQRFVFANSSNPISPPTTVPAPSGLVLLLSALAVWTNTRFRSTQAVCC